MISSPLVDSAFLVCTTCTLFPMATERRVRSGISFDPEVVETLDKHVKRLGELGVDRSEVVNAVLTEYFEDNSSSEAVWSAVNKRRIARRH